jgi:tRNA(Ile)-lysidine synthetase-like protein
MSVQLDQAGLRIRGNQLEILHQRPGTPVDFSREVRMTNADGILQIERKTAPSFQTESHRLALTHSGSTVFGGLTLFWEFQTERGNSAPGTEYFDAEAIGSEIQLRFWQAGDRFRPIGMAQEVKLQDLFTNAKIPADERRKRVVGLHASGKIFWVQGLRISEDFKVHSQSRQVLKWSWRPVAPGST